MEFKSAGGKGSKRRTCAAPRSARSVAAARPMPDDPPEIGN